MSDFTYSLFLPINHDIYNLFLYKYQVQNTQPPQRVYDTSAAPSTHSKCRAAARQQEYSRLRSRRKKKEKKKVPFRWHLMRGDAVQ